MHNLQVIFCKIIIILIKIFSNRCLEKNSEENDNIDLDKSIDKNLHLPKNPITELCIFFCGHKLHPECLENKTMNISANIDENTQVSNFNFQKDVCPSCFERQAVKSALKTGRNRITTLLSPK